MDATPPLFTLLPTRRVRLAARLAQLLLWLLVAFWLLVGISWGLLHGWIVPRISDWRPRLEVAASHLMGVPVRIGGITARSQGLIPSFEVTELLVLDRDGQPALRLPRVVAALSPTSLWGFGFEQLVIDQPELDIRRRADGQLEIAGLSLAGAADDPHGFARWAFAQTELVVRGGVLRWTDELKGAPPLVLTDVQAVLRNPGQRHLMRLDATPPAAWGERFSLRAALREPLLTLPRAGAPWQHWSGQLYAEFSQADVAQLRPHLDLADWGVALSSGQGALRAWADVSAGQLTGGTADVALQGVNVQLGPSLPALALSTATGRVGGRQLATGFEVRSEGLSFMAEDGLVWPGGQGTLLYTAPEGRRPARTEFTAHTLDLAALAHLAQRLPLAEAQHQQLASWAPQGLVEHLSARWEGPLTAPLALTARGRVTGLTLASATAAPQADARPTPGRPGVENADVAFELTPDGGEAQIQMAQGALAFPGVFEQPRIAFDQLSTDLQWKRNGARHEVSLRQLRFANADAQGQADLHWRSEAPSAALPVARTRPAPEPVHGLGVLDLSGSLSRGDARQVHRYLPLVLSEPARHYVRDAVTAGQLDAVTFKVKGALSKLPFRTAQDGEFSVSAKVSGVDYAYVPALSSTSPASSSSATATALPWPALAGMQGELVFNRLGMEVRGAQGQVAGLAGLQLLRGSARIALLSAPVVEVNTRIQGPLAQGLQFVNQSPVSALLGDALRQATANGLADYSMRLVLPLADLGKTSLQGSLTLPGNDVQFSPDTPLLAHLQGGLSFTDNSFQVRQAQARLLGGEIRFDGGLPAPGPGGRSADEPVVFRGRGTVTAEGLQQARELGPLATLARQASGSAAYSASLGFRRGQAEFNVTSSLQGLALSLPSPLGKTSAEALPLQLAQTLLRESLAPGQRLQDQLQLTLGQAASVRYVREVGRGAPRVLRGSVALGLAPGETLPLPEQGVAAHLRLAQVDVGRWTQLLDAPGAAAPATHAAAASLADPAYLPTRVALRADTLTYQGHQLHQVVLGSSLDGATWRVNMAADELNGYAEFRPGQAAAGTAGGQLFARLQRLQLTASTAQEVAVLLDQPPTTIPALDIVVQELELRGKRLGRVEIEAVNRNAPLTAGGGREWRLNKLNVSMPEAVLSASGHWAAPGAPSSPRLSRERRRVQMNFKLDIADSGALLTRLGMDGLLRQGRGRLEGQVGWLGSPLSLDYPSLGGQFNVDIEGGQFLKAEPGIAKLLGVLSLQSLPRRLTLDFRDVFSDGFAFDFVRGDVTIQQGQARTNNLQMKGLSAAVLMEGAADIARETQDLRVVVIPEVNAGTASLIATVINPAVGLGSFLAQMFLRRPLTEAATQEFHIDGAWSDPRIERVARTSPR